jgi:hypothetical protein
MTPVSVPFSRPGCGPGARRPFTAKEALMGDRPRTRFRPHLQPLEDRDTPGTLLVTAPSFIDPNVGLAVPDDAKPGLTTAEARTDGVIVWNPTR